MVSVSRLRGYRSPLNTQPGVSRDRALRDIYEAQRPPTVTADVWGDIFDAFMLEWAQSLVGEWIDDAKGKAVAA